MPFRNPRWINCGKESSTVCRYILARKTHNLVVLKGFWMSDKPLVQQMLATELAELLMTITSTDVSLAFLRGFWECTVREWNGIDRLRYGAILLGCFIFSNLKGRIDKYYMLIRRFVNSSFRLLIRAEWSDIACAEYSDILMGEGGPLW